MMTNVKGTLTVEIEGVDYTLSLGISVIADLQAKHGQDVLESLEPPMGERNDRWVPDMSVVTDIIIGALKRYHEEDATRWLADDIFAQNPEVVGSLIQAAFPAPASGGEARSGNSDRRKKAAR